MRDNSLILLKEWAFRRQASAPPQSGVASRSSHSVCVPAAAIAAASLILLLSACATGEDNQRLVPSTSVIQFNASDYRDFADYLVQTRDRLRSDKIYMRVDNAPIELAAATPFELRPAKDCPTEIGQNTNQKGILLIHGLSDMPIAMRDLSEAFADRCFLVRTILLPGHGTRAGDLLNVTRFDWLNASRFGLASLKADVDEVYVGGFSLGGLLAALLAIHDRDVRGVFAFSPALSLRRGWQLRQSVWLRHVLDWADTDEPDDYARYEAMPLNALAETYLLTQDLHDRLQQESVDVPFFMAQSSDDAIIDTESNNVYFTTRFVSPLNKAIVYKQNPTAPYAATDQRIQYANSLLPDQQIVGFSHQSVHIAPTNSHYGVLGDYRNCGLNSDRPAAEVARCLKVDKPWYTETFGDAASNLPKDAVVSRLTFNPLFSQLLDAIDVFQSTLIGENR